MFRHGLFLNLPLFRCREAPDTVRKQGQGGNGLLGGDVRALPEASDKRLCPELCKKRELFISRKVP